MRSFLRGFAVRSFTSASSEAFLRGFFIKHFSVGESSISFFVEVFFRALFCRGFFLCHLSQGFICVDFSRVFTVRSFPWTSTVNSLAWTTSMSFFAVAFREHSFAPTCSVLHFRSGFSARSLSRILSVDSLE